MMIKLRFINIKIPFLITSLFGIIACQEKFNYNERVIEASTYVGQDSEILHGLYFGMSKSAFFERCSVLNKEGLAEQGPRSGTVMSRVSGLSEEASVSYYPNYKGDTIVEMPLLFTYKAWAPWNKDKFSYELIKEVKKLIEKWYNVSLTLQKDDRGVSGYVGFYGSRLIRLYIQDDQYVNVTISDINSADINKEVLKFRNEM